MAVTLAEVLDHPLVKAASPQLLSGEGWLDRPVRWVHSADLYEIAPLLRGDEVLLTNGVGLVGVDGKGRRRYVRQLAQRGIAALLFEIGRPFTEVPDDMADEARRFNLPLVVLQPVLRFTEVAEAINSMVIDRSITRLRHADEISRTLSETLARGAALPEIVERIRTLAGSWITLHDGYNRLVASAGPVPEDRSTGTVTAPIMVEATTWGYLTIGTAAVPELLLEALLERAPAVLALALVRHQPGAASSLRLRQLLVGQLLEGQHVEEHVLQDRLRASGLPLSGHPYTCLVVDRTRIANSVNLLEGIVRACGRGVVGVSQDIACAVIAGGKETTAAELCSDTRAKLTAAVSTHAETCISIGPGTRNAMDLPYSMRQAQLTLRLAQQLHHDNAIASAQELAAERLLYAHGDRSELRRFVDEQLGPLLAEDAQRGTALVATLAAFLDCGGSKARTAQCLHMRRQSLYYRLNRVGALLPVDIDDPTQWPTLAMALKALRLLEGTVPDTRL
ncbi:PucR family transcriptional regulator [Thermoactinospora rubra]|uniref:PucR family transcriptional regulator n=1 Tax=Thermoactinospora rubra TaxID=1088767 RepID=UPI001301BF07|nr:PucR family transcriptional regulator [Thermoactinospora rubra]